MCTHSADESHAKNWIILSRLRSLQSSKKSFLSWVHKIHFFFFFFYFRVRCNIFELSECNLQQPFGMPFFEGLQHKISTGWRSLFGSYIQATTHNNSLFYSFTVQKHKLFAPFYAFSMRWVNSNSRHSALKQLDLKQVLLCFLLSYCDLLHWERI